MLVLVIYIWVPTEHLVNLKLKCCCSQTVITYINLVCMDMMMNNLFSMLILTVLLLILILGEHYNVHESLYI